MVCSRRKGGGLGKKGVLFFQGGLYPNNNHYPITIKSPNQKTSFIYSENQLSRFYMIENVT